MNPLHNLSHSASNKTHFWSMICNHRGSVRPSVCPSVCSSVRPSVDLSVHSSIHPSVWPSFHLYIHPSHCPSIRASVCLCKCKCEQVRECGGACFKPISSDRKLISYLNEMAWENSKCRRNKSSSHAIKENLSGSLAFSNCGLWLVTGQIEKKKTIITRIDR